MNINNETPVFRFAPSPNGELHLGHAYSALLNYDMAQKIGGRFLLRIEDIDIERCNLEFEAQMLDDLAWLGIKWDDKPRRQSEHFDDYSAALDALEVEKLVYPAFMSRSERKREIARFKEGGGLWPRDPDGAPLYPDADRKRTPQERREMINVGKEFALRLDMNRALDDLKDDLFWHETGTGPEGETGLVKFNALQWGDVQLGRRDVPASYHLAVVIDDALQGITHVVRGRDLFHATSVHRLLQELLGFSPPVYHHHDLILAEDDRKLSKSARDMSLRSLRNCGATAADIRRMVGLTPA